MELVFGVPQLFLSKEGSTIELILEKVTEDFLMSGKLKYIKKFIEKLEGAFGIPKVYFRGKFNFNCCTIKLGDGRK